MKHRTSLPAPGAPRPWLPTRSALLFAAGLTVSACGGDDDGDDTPVGPSGPVELTITGFLNNRDESFEPDAGEVVLSCDGTINVLFGPSSGSSLKNWALRPPGACGSYEQCGYIVLAITPEAGGSTKYAAAATLSILVAVSSGRQQLEAELFTGDEERFLQDQEPVKDSLSGVEFVAPSDCPPAPTGSGGTGSGGSSSASGGSAGAASTEGTGGSAGDGGAAGAAGDGGAAGDTQG